MKINRIYDRILHWAAHKHAPAYLCGLSFTESFFFPIPPDALLIPMALANKKKAWHFALITTIASVLGGLVGYTIGLYLYETIGLWLIELYGLNHHLEQLQTWTAQYGIWIIVMVGFLPIPYKVFTIASGASGMAVLPFAAGSLIGRAARFFVVSALCYWAGDSVNRIMKKASSPAILAISLILVVGFVFWTIH